MIYSAWCARPLNLPCTTGCADVNFRLVQHSTEGNIFKLYQCGSHKTRSLSVYQESGSKQPLQGRHTNQLDNKCISSVFTDVVDGKGGNEKQNNKLYLFFLSCHLLIETKKRHEGIKCKFLAMQSLSSSSARSPQSESLVLICAV